MRLHLFGSIAVLTIAVTTQASAQTPVNEALLAAPKVAPTNTNTNTVNKANKAVASQARAKVKSEVVLYSAAWCSYCKVAKMYLAEKKIVYREIDVDKPGGKAALAQIEGQSVPILLANGYRVAGFTTEAYDQVFAGSK